MMRTQIQLPEPDYERLRTEASRQRRSMADCIREGIQMFLERSDSKSDDIVEIAGKFRPLPLEDLKPHDRWFAEAADKPRSKPRRKA